MIELDRLTVALGRRTILHELSGAWHGKAIGLLGPNGAGKSTLVNTLLGFHRPRSGSARIYGHDVTQDVRRVRALVGYMPESDAFVHHLTGITFVRLMAELAGLPPAVALERAHEAMLLVGLGEVRYRKVGTYSLGTKQLLKLAQALAPGPRLVILDEPTNVLDPPARLRMIELIRQIRDGGSCRVLVSSHLLHDIEACCDQAVILREGRVVAERTLGQGTEDRRFLELELDGDAGPLAQALEAGGCRCARSGDTRLKVALAPGMDTRFLFGAAAERGMQVRQLTQARESLEDLFLHAMERKGAADARP